MQIEIKPSRSLFTRFVCLFIWLPLLCCFSNADTEYYRHVIFDNSLESDAYYYSEARASLPSSLELFHGKLPVSHDVFFTPPNAIRLKWRSARDGGWEASVRAIDFRNREMKFDGDVLYFWVFSKEGITGADLPRIWLSDAGRGFSRALELGKFQSSIPPAKWVQLAIPLSEFRTGSDHPFHSDQTVKLTFSQ